MTVKRRLTAVLRAPRSRRGLTDIASEDSEAGGAFDAAALQVMAHTLIADLFGAGLRVQRLAAQAPGDMQEDLEQVADQIDKAISDVRSFVFSHRTGT